MLKVNSELKSTMRKRITNLVSITNLITNWESLTFLPYDAGIQDWNGNDPGKNLSNSDCNLNGVFVAEH